MNTEAAYMGFAVSEMRTNFPCLTHSPNYCPPAPSLITGYPSGLPEVLSFFTPVCTSQSVCAQRHVTSVCLSFHTPFSRKSFATLLLKLNLVLLLSYIAYAVDSLIQEYHCLRSLPKLIYVDPDIG